MQDLNVRRKRQMSHLPEPKLVDFYRRLADQLEAGTLSAPQLKKAGEFYISYLFDRDKQNDSIESTDDEITLEDFKNFVCMGWYVYSNVLQDKTI